MNMTNLNLIILLLFKVSCIGGLQPNCNDDKELFANYLDTYKAQSLPFNLDRKGIANLRRTDIKHYFKLNGAYNKFLPNEIGKIDSLNSSNFSSLFLLPKLNDITIVLLMQDILIESPQYNPTRIHMISYNKDGGIVDFQEIAVFHPDVSEAFVRITDNYEIEKRSYQFKLNTNKEFSSLFYMIESIFKYKVSAFGIVEEVSKSKIEGYFEGNEEGYKLIKKLN